MSDSQISQDHDIPRFEPWLGVMCSAFVPVIAGLFLPGQFLAPMLVLSVVLFAIGLFMARRPGGRTRIDARGDAS